MSIEKRLTKIGSTAAFSYNPDTERLDADPQWSSLLDVKRAIGGRDYAQRYWDAFEFIEAHGLESELEAWLIEKYSDTDAL